MPLPVDIHIGRVLRRRRQLLGLTQAQLAEVCGLTFQQIHKYETAINSLSATRLWRLADALSVPVSYFFEGLPAEKKSFAPSNDHKRPG